MKLENNPLNITLEFFKNIEYDITCSICTDYLSNPVFCNKCKNNFCKECIKKWYKNNKNCPFKCEKMIFYDNRILNNIITEILKFNFNNESNLVNELSEKNEELEKEMNIIKQEKKYLENENLEIKNINNEL